jgi:RES domain-containing protein
VKAQRPRALWRISNHCDLAGLGGEKSDGRWHTAAPGKRIVYLSEHPAVALLETLANLKGNPALFPEKFQLMEVHVPDVVFAAMPALSDPKGNPFAPDAPIEVTRRAGDLWLKNKASALVSMPSFPSPRSTNVLLNPLHPDAGKVVIANCSWLKYDKRLFHVSPAPTP